MRLGPTQRDGDARSPHIGSVRMRAPSISMSVLECPSQVTRSPEAAGTARRAAVSVTSGSGQDGTRISLPNSHRLNAPQ